MNSPAYQLDGSCYCDAGSDSAAGASAGDYHPAHSNVSLLDQCGLTDEDIQGMRERSTLAGSVKQTVHRILLITPDQITKIWTAVSAVVVWEELLLFFVLGFVLPLIFKDREERIKIQQYCSMEILDADDDDDLDEETEDENDSNDGGENQDILKRRQLRLARLDQQKRGGHSVRSIQYTIASNIAQMAQLAFAIYMVDIVKVILQGMGFGFSQSELPHAFGHILYMMWILNRISAIKRFVLARHTSSDPNNLRGQVQLVDRLVDACLYCIGLYVTLDSVQEDMGAAAKGFVALGSVGTLVVSLASQGLAAQLFNGLFLASSNRIAVGEYVRFANGVSGTVIKLGWMETIIRGGDEVMITVPNKDLADQRVSNLSRVRQCAVKQTLRFKYSDIDKLPAVLETIKKEIKKACPDLIDDGSRPFRANLTAYHADHIAAHIDCRFRLKPLGIQLNAVFSHKFHQNRQNVLLAIAKAVKQYDVEFAVVDMAAVSLAMRLSGANGQPK